MKNISQTFLFPHSPKCYPEMRTKYGGTRCWTLIGFSVISHHRHVLDMNTPPVEHEEHPFAAEGESVSGAMYRYRKFTLPGSKRTDEEHLMKDIKMAVRTEINCLSGKKFKICLVFALMVAEYLLG